MSADESKKTTGQLLAKGTSQEGFSTKDVLIYQNVSHKGFSFEGRNYKNEWLIFFVHTLDIRAGESYRIEQSGSTGTATAHYQASADVKYDGISGFIKFVKFDKLTQEAVIEVEATIARVNSDLKEIVVKGEFSGFEGSN
ncbi:hypothetical protein ACIP1X_16565 [Pseudomonas sp. NPDC088885]|uniref:hypothetical protein n=1 Tax=Pseudomonas sp. NPDC088885 TaxID=3364457 RepID=UPI003812EA56